MLLPELPPAALRLAIDRDALAANWRMLDAMSGQASAGAAVKANAYGLGVAAVVPVLRDAGCAQFFVAHWSEVAAVAQHVSAGAISVLHGPLTAADAAYAKALGVKPVINSLPQAQRWREAGGGLCDLMVDTGMNRLGLPMSELGDPAIAGLEIDLLLSHLASADEDAALNTVQLARWEEARRAVAHRRASLANSAGIALGAAYHGDLTRPGLALYGGIPRAEFEGRIAQVARPAAAILQVREVAAGEGLGYNTTFHAPAPMRVGTIALGYADGYLRCWSGKGVMLSQGRRLAVLGRVSMDMTIIDLSAAPDLREGDWVEAEYEPVAAAAQSGLSQYELFTLLGARFGR
ncbi:alanine racemase [Novosphingobium sp. JCM 18896]|uniref:alanine racemase n=1 Tax=Novosphingobium sp. JCM 18896 TaxID=2989731 RepID=UPI002223D655|nr:alanine racemase [Novosphingobium sp. JCM 18896]MCW1428449.1 alanine racemase [Novosphingobium sp. JCM 18896]